MYEDSPSWRSFRMGVRAEKTWKGYSADFHKFLDFVKLDPARAFHHLRREGALELVEGKQARRKKLYRLTED
jgi:hypothetical protein